MNTSILGLIIANCYLAHKGYSGNEVTIAQAEFYVKLSGELLDIGFDSNATNTQQDGLVANSGEIIEFYHILVSPC